MDRLFLDANILFSAAYRANAGLQKFWKLKDVELCSSHYALEEARINLRDQEQRGRLTDLEKSIKLFDPVARALPDGITLAEKDIPILLAAIAARATHLITGDLRDFGRLFGKRVEGALILTPANYLKSRIGGR